MVYRLDGSDLVVEVPYDQIVSKSPYQVVGISILPMMGAVNSTDSGYLMVPEGGGALIRCNNGKVKLTNYAANLYGWDYGVERLEAKSETRANFGAFAILRDSASMLCVLEEGETLAEIRADIAKDTCIYNTVYSRYTTLHYNQYNMSQASAANINMFETIMPDVTATQRYRFIASGDYADVAVAYGDYLT